MIFSNYSMILLEHSMIFLLHSMNFLVHSMFFSGALYVFIGALYEFLGALYDFFGALHVFFVQFSLVLFYYVFFELTRFNHIVESDNAEEDISDEEGPRDISTQSLEEEEKEKRRDLGRGFLGKSSPDSESNAESIEKGQASDKGRKVYHHLRTGHPKL